MKTIPELDQYIAQYIQGVFSQADMAVLKTEIEKLQPGQVYVEIGVDEGRSARVAHEYAHPEVFKMWIDINNVDHHEKSIGRGKRMQQEGMVGIGHRGFFVHGDGDEFAKLIRTFFNKQFVDLIFIDGHHDYESVKENTLFWEPFMKKGSVMLFHDYDHPETARWLDKYYGDKKEVFHGKVVKVIV